MENINETTPTPESAPESAPEQTPEAAPQAETTPPSRPTPTPDGAPKPPHGAPIPPSGAQMPPHGARFSPMGWQMPPHMIPPRFTPVTAGAPQMPQMPQMPYMPYIPQAGGIPPFSPAAEKKKKKRIWPFILIGVLAFLMLSAALIGLAMSEVSEEGSRAAALPTDGGEYVAVLYIDTQILGDYVTATRYGAQSGYDQVFYLDTIESLIADTANVGMMLYINSPGGEVTATDELGRAIARYKKETERPVFAYFGDMAASGAYWVGSYADKIIASKFSTVGSIGVTYGTHIDISELLDRLGIKATELTAGDNKAMGSMYSPLTEEQKRMYQEQLDEMHEMFIDVVATNRKLDKAKVRAIADGRTFLASKALKHGLIDGIGYFEDAKVTMQEYCSLGEVTFYDCVPEYDYSSTMLYYLSSESTDKTATAPDDEAIAALVEELSRGRRFMALYR